MRHGHQWSRYSGEGFATLPEPALSSIECGYERIGVRAAELLEELMDGGPPPTEPIRIAPVELIPRTTTDAFAVDDPFVARALQFIASTGNRPLKVEDVVEQVPVGGRTLERRFQKLLGRTVSQEITRMRIERVKRLLVETKFPIKKVATACGFANASRLCKTFRQAEGTTRSEYRRTRTSV
ncbi:MAG: helix-turn-helix domain-containing protein [Pirellulales bacterium]